MIKSKVNHAPEVYKDLPTEATGRYGITKTLSRIIGKSGGKISKKRMSEIVSKTKGSWKMKETGMKYKRRMRTEW